MLIAIAKQCSRQELWRRRRGKAPARLLWCSLKQPQLIAAYEREEKYRRKILRTRGRAPRGRTMHLRTLRRQVNGWQQLGCVLVQVRRIPDPKRPGKRRSLANIYTLTAIGADYVRAIHAGTRIPLITIDWEIRRPRRRA